MVVTQHCECAKSHRVVHFTVGHFMLCEFHQKKKQINHMGLKPQVLPREPLCLKSLSKCSAGWHSEVGGAGVGWGTTSGGLALTLLWLCQALDQGDGPDPWVPPRGP